MEAFLRKNDIKYQVKDHKEVFTVNAMMECVKDLSGMHMKNLFLRDKKKNYYLLAAKHDAQVIYTFWKLNISFQGNYFTSGLN